MPTSVPGSRFGRNDECWMLGLQSYCCTHVSGGEVDVRRGVTRACAG